MKRPRPGPMCQPTHSGYSLSSNRVVVCFDLDCFYAQVVEVENPSLKGRPVAIQQKYIVVTCNYEARKLGVTKLGNLEKAKRNVPGLVIIDGSDLTRFRAASKAINRVWESYGCPVERLGMDEVFMDITSFVMPGRRIKPSEDCHTFGDPNDEHARTLCLLRAGAAFAQEARARLFRELGFTCCAGVSCGKIAAKLAAEMHKPNQQTLLLPSAFSALIGTTEVRRIQGIGRKSRRMLAEKCGGPAPLLCGHVRALGLKGIRGVIENDAVSQFIWNAVTGVDTDPVKASGMAKTISVEETSLPHPTSLEAAMTRMNSLASRLLPMIQTRLEQGGDLPKTLRLTIHNAAPPRESTKGDGHPSGRRSRYSTKSRSVVLEPEAFRSQAAIFRAATPLLRSLCPPDAPLKLSRVNLGASNFSKVSARQVSGVRVMEAFLKRSPTVVPKTCGGDRDARAHNRVVEENNNGGDDKDTTGCRLGNSCSYRSHLVREGGRGGRGIKTEQTMSIGRAGVSCHGDGYGHGYGHGDGGDARRQHHSVKQTHTHGPAEEKKQNHFNTDRSASRIDSPPHIGAHGHEWTCDRCTFRNQKLKHCCEVCGAMRGRAGTRKRVRRPKSSAANTITAMFRNNNS